MRKGGDQVAITPINPAHELWLGLQAPAVCSSIYMYRDVINYMIRSSRPVTGEDLKNFSTFTTKEGITSRRTHLDHAGCPENISINMLGRRGRAARPGGGGGVQDTTSTCALRAGLWVER